MTAQADPPLEFDGFVLAGGRSTRMGRDKALLEWDGTPLVERALASLRTVITAPRIAGDRPDLIRFAPIVEDLYPAAGPLAGIHAALASAVQDWSIFLPVDLPLLPPGFLRWLVDRVSLTGALATVPVVTGMPQPLVAIYHRRLLLGIASRLKAGYFSTIRAIAAAADEQEPATGKDFFSVECLVATGQLSSVETQLPCYRWFQNVNTPSEVQPAASDW